MEVLIVGAVAALGFIALTCWSIESSDSLRQALVRVVLSLVLIVLLIVVTLVLVRVLDPKQLEPG